MKQSRWLLPMACAALLGMTPAAARSEDASALYKSKCAVCHAPNGSGRKALKGSNLLADAVKQRSDTQLAEAIANGVRKGDEAHAYAKKGISSGQVQALVEYIRGLQKK